MKSKLMNHITLWLSALDIDAYERPELANTITQMCEYFYKLGNSKK